MNPTELAALRTKALEEYYEQLRGARVLRIALLPDPANPRNPVPHLQLQKPDGTFLYVSVQCDAEGNGAGHLDITS